MDLSRRLHLLLELDELKSETCKTREIVAILHELIRLDGDRKAELQLLVDKIRQCYSKMLDSVKRRRSVCHLKAG